MTAGRLLMTAMCMAVLPKLSAALTKCQTSPLDSRFKLLLLCQTALSLNSLCEFRLAKDLLLNMARCGVCSWLCSWLCVFKLLRISLRSRSVILPESSDAALILASQQQYSWSQISTFPMLAANESGYSP